MTHVCAQATVVVMLMLLLLLRGQEGGLRAAAGVRLRR